MGRRLNPQEDGTHTWVDESLLDTVPYYHDGVYSSVRPAAHVAVDAPFYFDALVDGSYTMFTKGQDGSRTYLSSCHPNHDEFIPMDTRVTAWKCMSGTTANCRIRECDKILLRPAEPSYSFNFDEGYSPTMFSVIFKKAGRPLYFCGVHPKKRKIT